MSAMDALKSLDQRQITLLVAGLCVLGSCHMCTQIVSQHFFHWTKPREQMAIVYIVMMVPIFAIDSYVGLVEMPSWEVYSTILDSIKECYEAFVIANFLRLMYCYMGISPDPAAPLPDAIKGRMLHHSFPVTLFQPHEVIVDKVTLATLSRFTTQFVIIRPLFSLLLCVLEVFHLDVPPFTYLFTAVFNVSVYLAIYALLAFYHTFDKELKPHNPLLKFLCIKGVVFFSFWQGLVIQLLAAVGFIHQGHFPFTVAQIEEAMQNFLVCLEMLLFSFAFMYAFSAKEYTPSFYNEREAEEKMKRRRDFYGLDEKKEKEKKVVRGASVLQEAEEKKKDK